MANLYDKCSPEFMGRLLRAREAVANMDAIDGGTDFNPRTIQLALICGLNHPETNAGFDALVMLEQLIDHMQNKSE